jgi:hypothetical protein
MVTQKCRTEREWGWTPETDVSVVSVSAYTSSNEIAQEGECNTTRMGSIACTSLDGKLTPVKL